MKHKVVCFLCIILVFVGFFMLESCNNISLPAFQGDQILLFAKPEGGIAVYDFSRNKTFSITKNKDYYPHFVSSSQMIYFIRIIQKETGNTINQTKNIPKLNIPATMSTKINRTFEIRSYDLKRNIDKKISSVLLYDPGSDPRDFFKFVDQEKKLLIFSYFAPAILFEVKSGKVLQEDLSVYFPECNEYKADGSKIFLHVRQIPNNGFLKSTDQIESSPYYDGLYELSNNGRINKIKESGIDKETGKSNIYKKYFFGFSYNQFKDQLVFSYDHEIFLRMENREERILFQGVHPSFVKQSLLTNQNIMFPFFHCSYLLQNKESLIFGNANRLSIYDLKTNQLHHITTTLLELMEKNPGDPLYLFDHLEWISFTKNPRSILVISSKKMDKSAGPSNIVAINKNPDYILLFQWENGVFTKQFQMIDKTDFKFEFTDLNSDGKNEILVQYSASDFGCEERFQAAGRSIIWKDVFMLNPKNIYEIANNKFPSIYKDWLETMRPFYNRALTAKRLKEPIICDEDLKILERLIREAEIATFSR